MEGSFENRVGTLALVICGMIGLGESAHSAHVVINTSSASEFSLDIDQDGIPEIGLFGLVPDDSSGFQLTVDALSESTDFISMNFVGIATERTDSIGSLFSSSFITGDFTAPNTLERAIDGANGAAFVLKDFPVLGLWFYGSSGSSGQPVHLLGAVADFTDFYLSGGTGDVNFYYHDFGTFDAGQSSGPISLRSTGIPEPSALVLSMLLTARIFRRRRGRR